MEYLALQNTCSMCLEQVALRAHGSDRLKGQSYEDIYVAQRYRRKYAGIVHV